MNKLKTVALFSASCLLLLSGCQTANQPASSQSKPQGTAPEKPAKKAPTLDRASLLPPAAQSYVRISNTTNFWNKLHQSSLGKLWVDQQFQDFLRNPDAEIWYELFFENGSTPEDNVFIEQLKLLKGEVVLGFDMERKAPCIIAAMTEDDFIRRRGMDVKLREITTKPFEIVKSTFQDVDIFHYIENGGTQEEKSSWQTHLKGTLVFGYSKKWIEKCIIQLQKDDIKEPKGNPMLAVNVPLHQLIRDGLLESMKREAAQSQTPAIYDPEVLLDALGLMGVENYSLNIELKDTEIVADSNLRVSDLTKGIFTILDVKPSKLQPINFIPENLSSIEVGRFNLLRFWQEIPTVLASSMPAVKPQFDMIMAMVQQQVGIDLGQDLLAHIGSRYFSFSAAEADTQVSVVAVELNDGGAFRANIETALTAPALQAPMAAGIEREAFLEHTIYTIKDKVSDDDNAAFSVAGDYLLCGQPKGLRQVIRSLTSDASTNTAFERSQLVKGLRQHVPSRAFCYSAIDWGKTMALIVSELSKSEYITFLQQYWAKSGSPFPPPDFNKLPPAEHISSFFNVSYQYAEATESGIHQQIILKY